MKQDFLLIYSMRYILYVILFLLPLHSIGQSKPFAIWEDNMTSDYWFVSIDALTGVKTNINSIPGLNAFVSGNNTTINTDLQLYHFMGLSGTDIKYYTIDIFTGNVISSPVITDNIVGIHYNCNDSMYYGLREISNAYDLIRLDPLSGTITSIAPVNGIIGYIAETFSFNPKEELLSFAVITGANAFLRSYSTRSGLFVHNNIFNDNVTAHKYSCADSSLYGLWEDAGVYKFERINLSTGTHSTVHVLSGVTPGYVFESASMNSNGIFVYRGFDGTNNTSIISINATTGNVLNVVNTSDNAVGFEERDCCYNSLNTNITLLKDNELFRVSPSPFTDKLKIESALDISEVILYSLDGKILFEHRPNTSSETLSFSTPNLEQGVYILKVSFLNGHMGSQKLIKCY